jgi:hypothetical protein
MKVHEEKPTQISDCILLFLLYILLFSQGGRGDVTVRMIKSKNTIRIF